ncbi:Formyl-CoA:oxalate CoA-transferase [Streptomyces violaceorubidus]
MQPLRGVTVVSLEQAIAAPYASRQLADLGARVIKVERPGTGDFARAYDSRVRGLSSHFVWVNRNKESLTLDFKDPRGLELLRRLVADADVFLQNLAPGAAARAGLGARELRAAHPGLIVCDISGYGAPGPYADRKAYDLLVQSEAGLLSVTGTPDDMAKAGVPVSDIAAGMYAYSSILAALLERGRTGRGAHLDVTRSIGWSQRRRERPDLDVEPLEVLSRVSRLARHLDRARRLAFSEHQLEPWEFDVLTALRRAGTPYQLSRDSSSPRPWSRRAR